MEEWSNYAVLGYLIAGAKELELEDEEIKKLVRSVRVQFDWISVEEAEDIYRKSPY